MSTTTDLEDFGKRERWLLVELLTAWDKYGLPSDFEECEVVPMMNSNSGFVFLTNSDSQVAMMNGDRLESFYTSPYSDVEGFYDELKEREGDFSEDDAEWFNDIKILRNE